MHTPSEHTVDGKAADLDLHIVHEKENGGGYAVLGFLFYKQETNDKAVTLTTTEDLLNTVKFEQSAVIDEKKDRNVNIDAFLKEIVSKEPSYWSYSGSLTTPPCTEGIDWTVF